MEQEHTDVTEQGFWWLPDSPDKRLVGTVKYAPRAGLELDLVGSLLAIENGPTAWSGFDVWGNTVRGKAITLLRAHQSNLQTHSAGWPTSTIESSRGIVGGHYRGGEDVLLHTLDSEFDFLAAWAGQSGVTQTHNSESHSSQITITPGESVPLGGSEGISIELVPSILQRHSRQSLTLEENCELRLRSGQDRPFPQFERLISSFRTLLTFAAGEAAHPGRMIGKTGEKTAEIQGHTVWHEVEIVRQIRVPPRAREVHAEDMLFTLRDLQPDPVAMFERFLDVQQELKPVFELFFPTYFYPEMPPPQQFLNLAHAIEAFHRTTVGGEYQGEEEYSNGLKKRLQQAIPSDVSEDFRQSLNMKLKFLHQYSLRKRLRDVLRNFASLVVPYIPDQGEFIESVAEARNCLVHASIDRAVPDYIELWRLTQQLGLVLEIALLSRIGFEEDRVRSIVSRSKRARMIRANIVSE